MAFVTIKDKDNATLGHLQTDAHERLGVHNLLHVQERKAVGVLPGTLTAGAWRTRPLSDVVTNNIVSAVLGSSQVTLPAGTYCASFFGTSCKTNSNKCRLYNITGDAVLGEGSTNNAHFTYSMGFTSFGFCVFTLSAQSVLELQHACETTAADVGLGVGLTNIGQGYNLFADLKIWKVA